MLALLTAVVGCSSDSPPPETISGRPAILPQRRLVARLREAVTGGNQTPPAGSDVVILDASATSSASVGDLLVVELAMSAGTGYQWKCVRATDSAAVVSPKFDAAAGAGVEKPRSQGLAGGPVDCIFEFSVVGPGTATLSFELVRPWEKDAAPADRRTLTLTVTAPES